jgi:hypothetical protein
MANRGRISINERIIMMRIVLLMAIGALISGGWVWARGQEMLDHSGDVKMEEMQSASCPPSSNPQGNG